MTVVLETATAPLAPALPQSAPHDDAAQAREDIIGAHRQALLELAPHQEDRAARIETGWHMERLGLLLCQRDRLGATQTPPHPALEALRTGQAARVQAARVYREAGGDPVEEIMTLLPRTQGEGPLEQQKAAPGMVPNRERPEESTGTARSRR